MSDRKVTDSVVLTLHAGEAVALHSAVDLLFDAVERSWSPLSDSLRVKIARTLPLTRRNAVWAGHFQM